MSSAKVKLETLHHLKLNLPKFEGAEVTEWLQDGQQYIETLSIGKDKQVVIASMHLKGAAKE